MKHLHPVVICALLLTGVALSGQALLPRPPLPDLVLFNGKVITVDRESSIHQAVAIIGDQFLAVGTDEQMKAVAGPASLPSPASPSSL